MSNDVRQFLAAATRKAAADLLAAVEALPEEKRIWSPMEKGRSAVDQAAECALLNGMTAAVIVNRNFPGAWDFETYMKEKVAFAQNYDDVVALLKENSERVAAAIEAVPETDLETTVAMPWGDMTLLQIMSYPFWNMSYHEGQTNYIASIT